jgi:ribosome-associated translation inhibitor RaiA
MGNLLNPAINIMVEDADVKAFVYQQIAEFEPYVTPETVVAVVARDPRKLALQLETDGKDMESTKLREMFRIAIVLREEDTKLEGEGFHEDVYEAIRMAKENLMKKLAEIHDNVISQSDRIEQINFALSNPQLH